MKNYNEIIKAAEAGAEKYFSEQMKYLETFSGIDCGTENVEGNAKVVAILKELLESMGAKVEIHHVEGLGSHITAKLTPPSPD